jgi:hypothetical protein
MKLLALLALLPAALAVPSPMPAPEAYNPFFAPANAVTHSNNPISHSDLNSRRHLSAIQDQVVIGQSRHEIKKRSGKVRKVKRQSTGSCVPKGTTTGTGTTVVSTTTKAGTATQGQATTKPTTTTKAQATTKTTTKASTTSTTPKPAATNFTVDPDGNGPFKGQATCEYLRPTLTIANEQTTTLMSDMVCPHQLLLEYTLTGRILWSMAQKLGTYSRPFPGINGQLARIQRA